MIALKRFTWNVYQAAVKLRDAIAIGIAACLMIVGMFFALCALALLSLLNE